MCVSAEQESLGWGPVLASLQVPELTVEDFLSESQSGGSYLTLYAFILQRLNTEYTAANERRILALINTWTNQVFPRFEPSFVLSRFPLFGVMYEQYCEQYEYIFILFTSSLSLGNRAVICLTCSFMCHPS